MSQKYYALVTAKGNAKLRAALEGLSALTLSHIAFGDGGGNETAPGTDVVALVNERYRAPITDKKPHETNPSILYVEAVIPPGVGGWTLREAGIYDTDGDLIVIAKLPMQDVALISEGASTEGLARIALTFESIQTVEFFIDPTVLLATQAWVIERIISRPFITVESITLAAPPTAPASHALYVVPANATGAWAGKTHQMAYWHGAWLFAAAPVAKVVGASDTGKYYRRTAIGWVEFVGDEITPGFLRLATDAEHKAGMLKNVGTHPAGVAGNVQSGTWNYAVATGTANAVTITLNPVPTDYPNALKVAFSTTNTGAATIKVNTLSPVNVVRFGGSALQQGDLPVGGAGLLVWDGTRYQIMAIPPAVGGIAVFKDSGSFTVPAGVTVIKRARGWGAGGGGGGSYGAGSGGGGGGGGAYGELLSIPVTPGTVIPVVIGGGGATGSNAYPPQNGGNGGATSFGSYLTIPGGGGGYNGNGVLQSMAGYGGPAPTNASLGVAGSGGGSAWSAGGTPASGIGGASPFGGGSPSPNVGAGSMPGNAPGGGANGGNNGGGGASGAGGLLIVEY